MNIVEAVATILAISLAGERIVAMVKAMAPRWFQENKPEAGVVAPTAVEDSGRKLRVQIVAFASCWAAAAAMVTPGDFLPFNAILLGGTDFPVVLVGLLAMGGSAFWTQVLGIASALKDLKQVEVAAKRTESASPPNGPGPIPAKVHLPGPVVRGAAGEAANQQA